MNGQWSKEKAWQWYNARPWIRGCNYMPSDCANRVDEWQEFGFAQRLETAKREIALAEEIGFNSVRIILEFQVWDRQHDGFMQRLDQYLALFAQHGISAMVVLANDCCVPKSKWKPIELGPQPYDLGYHGGTKNTPHFRDQTEEPRWNVLDDPDIRPRYYAFAREILQTYAHDDRVIVWDLFNEPGGSRGLQSMPYLEKLFEIAWSVAPDQPLCADVWNPVKGGRACDAIEQRAMDLSDVISWHNYGSFDSNIDRIEQLRTTGRPLINTEWLNRILHNTVEETYPLFYLEKIGCYNWGFVAGKSQTYEPWESLWQNYDEGRGRAYDFTKWQHDLFRPSLRPYDPREIEVIRHYNKKADARFRSGLDGRLFHR